MNLPVCLEADQLYHVYSPALWNFPSSTRPLLQIPIRTATVLQLQTSCCAGSTRPTELSLAAPCLWLKMNSTAQLHRCLLYLVSFSWDSENHFDQRIFVVSFDRHRDGLTLLHQKHIHLSKVQTMNLTALTRLEHFCRNLFIIFVKFVNRDLQNTHYDWIQF